MATVRKRGDAQTYFLDGIFNGKRLRIPLETTDRRQAMIMAREKIAELEDDPGQQLPHNTRLYAFLDQYVRHSQTLKKAPGTTRNEKYIIKEFKAVVEDQKLERFGPKQADEFFMKLSEHKRTRLGVETRISGHGKNLYLRTLKMIWNVGVRWKLVKENPFATVKRFGTDSEPARVLSDAEIKTVLKKMDEIYPELSDLARFYLFTGMRRAEALTLQWEHVNFKEGYITIVRTKHRKFRVIPLFDVTRRILEARRALPAPFSDAPAADTVTHRFIEVFAASGIPHARLHDLRKTFGTMLARENVSPMTIMQWLGHTNSSVTMNHYIGLDRETAERLRYIGGGRRRKVAKA